MENLLFNELGIRKWLSGNIQYELGRKTGVYGWVFVRFRGWKHFMFKIFIHPTILSMISLSSTILTNFTLHYNRKIEYTGQYDKRNDTKEQNNRKIGQRAFNGFVGWCRVRSLGQSFPSNTLPGKELPGAACLPRARFLRKIPNFPPNLVHDFFIPQAATTARCGHKAPDQDGGGAQKAPET